MQNHNNKEYNSQKQNKQFIKYNQTLKLLYKKPQQNNQQQQPTYQNENVNNRATNSNFKGVGNQQQTATQNQKLLG